MPFEISAVAVPSEIDFVVYIIHDPFLGHQIIKRSRMYNCMWVFRGNSVNRLSYSDQGVAIHYQIVRAVANPKIFLVIVGPATYLGEIRGRRRKIVERK